jgi:hypothetical protein
MSQIGVKVAGEEKLDAPRRHTRQQSPYITDISRDGDRKRNREAVGAKKWGGSPEA